MNSSSTGISDNKSTSISKKTTSMDSDEPFYEMLLEANKYINKYRLFICHIGTTSDTAKLRSKIERLQVKLMTNAHAQVASISQIIKSSTVEKERLEHILCFTLNELAYLESINQKLVLLLKLYPSVEGEKPNELSVNLGYEDSEVEEKEEPEVEKAVAATALSEKTKDDTHFVVPRDPNEQIELIHKLVEEIEHADTNLIRFNLRKNTSEFVEKLCKLDVTATSHDDANHHANHSNHHHHDAHVAAVGKTASDEKVTVRTSSHHHHHPEAYRDCCTVLLPGCCAELNKKRRMAIYAIIFVTLLLAAAGISCGLVFGLRKG